MVNVDPSATVTGTATPLMNTYNWDPTNFHADDVASYPTGNPAGSGTVTSVQFAGFSLIPDVLYTADPNILAGSSATAMYLRPDTVVPVYYSLQYRGPDGNYHPYNFWSRVSRSNNAGKQFKTNDYQSVNGGNAASRMGAAKVEPRTDRFSASNCWWGPDSPTQTMNFANASYNSPSGGGYGGGGDYCVPYFAVPTMFTSSPFTYVPAYLPVTVRRGLAGRLSSGSVTTRLAVLASGRNYHCLLFRSGRCRALRRRVPAAFRDRTQIYLERAMARNCYQVSPPSRRAARLPPRTTPPVPPAARKTGVP